MLRSVVKYGRALADAVSGKDVLTGARTVLFQFNSQRDVERWHVMTDEFWGGRSSGSLVMSPGGDAAVFSGRLSTQHAEDASITRSGYCCTSSRVHDYGEYLDVERHSHLVFELRGDGRTYIANVRVETMSGTGGDVWQAPFTPSAGSWSLVRIPFTSLAMTQHGQLVGKRFRVDQSKVISVGLAVSAADVHNAAREARDAELIEQTGSLPQRTEGALRAAVPKQPGTLAASPATNQDAPSRAAEGSSAVRTGEGRAGDAEPAGMPPEGPVELEPAGVALEEEALPFRLELRAVWAEGLAEPHAAAFGRRYQRSAFYV